PSNETVAMTPYNRPDPLCTPLLLDILHAYGEQATFFVIGTQAIKHPRLLSRMRAEGHEIGNHTYNHPAALESAPEWRFSLELSTTQRVTEAATGHSATLFRYPYMSSLAGPQDADQAASHRVPRLGYQLVRRSSERAARPQPS